MSISGTPQTEYVSSETPMHAILHFHLALENRRNKASLENSTGPKVSCCYVISYLNFIDWLRFCLSGPAGRL